MRRGMARTAGCICILALVLQACATTGAMDSLDSEEDLPASAEREDLRPPWEARNAEADEEARQAETSAALSGMRGVLGQIDEAGVELTFRFWAQNGALTLLSWKRGAGEAGLAEKVDSFVPGLEAWFVSSLAMRGGLALFEAVAPRLAPILARGGSETVAWFRSFLARVRPAEREQFHRLWTKAQTQGLSAAEKEQFRKLMARFEKLLDTKLDELASRDLRRMAQNDFYEKLHTNLAKLLLDEDGNHYPVHHRIPLEYAHLFERLNINARENLWGVHEHVHKKINKVWTSFRRAKGKATAEDVRKVATLVDRHFGRWLNQRYEVERSASELARAEADALKEVKVLVDLIVK